MGKLINYILPLLFFLVSCHESERNRGENNSFSLSGNKYARLFMLSDSGNYYRLDIRSPWQGGDEVIYTYYLTEGKSSLPADADSNRIIRIPVTTSVCMSTTHVAMISKVGGAKGIVGVSGPDYITNSIVRSGIEAGTVYDVGYGNSINNELISSLNPDLVFVYGIGPESAGYVSKLHEAGINTIFICDYLETHPLARAEWLKLFGLIYGRKEMALTAFNSISGSYEKIRSEIAAKIDTRPGVMLGLPFKDKWFVSPGNSYISRLISDAGGSYIWSEISSSTSMPLSIESVYLKGLEADYWLNTGVAESMAELLSVDHRFRNLPAVQGGKLYNNTGRINSSGGNDYWEGGCLSPDTILMDIASILHPGIIKNHKLSYYKKLK